ncbi:MAG: ABC transporter ATP-binding protein, partial [Litorivicinaceae bacterium]
QMLAIGRALMTNPKFMILDEATEGLAPKIREEIWHVLEHNLKESGQAILVIDKHPEAMARMADRHYVMDKGSLVWQGDSRALLRSHEMLEQYLGV